LSSSNKSLWVATSAEIKAAEKELLTVREAARSLTLRPSTVRAWLLRRKLRFIRLSARCVRIPRSEIDRVIREGTVLPRESK
jgi:excisionase family DNA binding protein